MNSKGVGRKRPWLNFMVYYYLGICLEGLRGTTKTLSKDSLPRGRDLNPELAEHEA
jgi:hypothetical protein